MGQRPPSASDSTSHAHERQRIEDAPHGPLAQGGVAVERRLDGMAADNAHHQPRARAGVAEVEDALPAARREPTPHPSTCQRPGASRSTFAPRARAGGGGAQHVVALQQALHGRAPVASSPRMSARWEMDLSPGGRRRPFRGAPAAAERGWAGPWPEGAEARELSAWHVSSLDQGSGRS